MAANESLEHILDKEWEDKPLKELMTESPAVLQGVTDADAQHLADAFGIKTVEDLATCKFILWAQALATLAKYEK